MGSGQTCVEASSGPDLAHKGVYAIYAGVTRVAAYMPLSLWIVVPFQAIPDVPTHSRLSAGSGVTLQTAEPALSDNQTCPTSNRIGMCHPGRRREGAQTA